AEPTTTWFLCTQMMLHPVALDVVPQAVTEAGLRVAGVLHDVIPYRYPDRYLVEDSARVQARMRAGLVRTFDRLLSNSTFSADTASNVLGFSRDRIHVVGAAIEPQFVPANGQSDVDGRLTRLVEMGLDLGRRRRPASVTAWGTTSRATGCNIIWVHKNHVVVGSARIVERVKGMVTMPSIAPHHSRSSFDESTNTTTSAPATRMARTSPIV
ncbi:MAG: hypothetical protein EB147_11770, partial [Acidimicrobiia bacterium]|nr:hypothetical protein [Acidimicrobiia bacterium]